ncbi:hypothetical protein HON03_05235 [archaeon]|jgi:hypothetical protein|nr:hypothetical protein [archaeon]MBT5287992.1 hypothetical protein [archaeon]
MKSPLEIGQDYVRNLESKLFYLDPILSLYQHGSSTTEDFIPGISDIDLWMILKTTKGHHDIELTNQIYSIHESFIKNCDTPVDIIIYGDDELPLENNIGYSLLKSLFIFDYKKSAILLLGEDILPKLIDIDIKIASLELVNQLKRGVRQRLSYNGYLSSPEIVRRFLGDRCSGNTYVTEDIGKDLERIDHFTQYAVTIAAKCRLSYSGKVIVSKDKVLDEYIQIYEEEDFTDVVREVQDCRNKNIIKSDLPIKCYRFVEFVSQKLEVDYNGRQD